ncbi:MAG: hypothetical protein ACHQ52_01845 [Candidatus Eisenbacteria bacterium]
MIRWLAVLLALVAMVLLARPTWHTAAPASGPGGTAGTVTGAANPTTGAAAGVDRATALAHPEIGFHSRERLLEHWQRHGAEFGAASPEAYLRLAQTLRDRPAGGTVLEAARADGAITRFDRATGAFLAYDEDLTIRTFFRPNEGERYFHRQLEREPTR